MAFGIHLGTLLVCLVQAEHVSRLWNPQGSQKQNGNTDVGFSSRISGQTWRPRSFPQNQFRQASTASGSLEGGGIHRTVPNSTWSQAPSNRHHQVTSLPAKSDYSVIIVRPDRLASPVLQNHKLYTSHGSGRRYPGNAGAFALSTDIASGSAINAEGSKASRTNDVIRDANKSVFTRRLTAPVQSTGRRAGQDLFRGPSRESFSSSRPAPAQDEPPPAYYAQLHVGDVKVSPRLFTGGSHTPVTVHGPNQPGRTMVRVPGRRVLHPDSFRRVEVAPRAHGRGLGQFQEQKSNPGQLSPTHRGRGPYDTQTSSVEVPPSSQSSILFPPQQRVGPQRSGRPDVAAAGYGFSEKQQNPSVNMEGAKGTPKRFYPTRVHKLPERFGGTLIRRLRDPLPRLVSGVSKPHAAYSGGPPEGPSRRAQKNIQSKWVKR